MIELLIGLVFFWGYFARYVVREKIRRKSRSLKITSEQNQCFFLKEYEMHISNLYVHLFVRLIFHTTNSFSVHTERDSSCVRAFNGIRA